MKELTIGEKAKRYDEAIKKAKALYNVSEPLSGCNVIVETLFPELKESEDERIRMGLINYFKHGILTPEHPERKLIESWIAWLEKQGEQKPADKEYTFKAIPRLLEMIQPTDRAKSYCQKLINSLEQEGYSTDAKIVSNCLKQMNGEKVPMATMDEHKPNDKVEPKFHKGDWVICCDYEPVQIISIRTNAYEMSNGDIRPFYMIDNNHNIRLWTIQDAKDGDILCTYECNKPKIVFILKGTPEKHYALSYHCYYNIMYHHFGSDSEKGCLAPNDEDVKPATKEQRDILEKAMADAGYIFEKKELKNIGECNGEDFGIDGLWHAQNILEKTLGKVDGYQSDDGILEHKCAITAIKKLYEQEPTKWSKEDERVINAILAICDDFKVGFSNRKVVLEDIEEIEHWLESLKDKAQSKKQWKPSKEQMEALGVATNISNVSEKEYVELEKLYQDLRKLKEE